MIMTYDLDELIKNIGGTFRFTTLLIRRARELAGGATKLVETDSNDPTTIALEEFASNKISLESDELKKTEEMGT